MINKILFIKSSCQPVDHDFVDFCTRDWEWYKMSHKFLWWLLLSWKSPLASILHFDEYLREVNKWQKIPLIKMEFLEKPILFDRQKSIGLCITKYPSINGKKMIQLRAAELRDSQSWSKSYYPIKTIRQFIWLSHWSLFGWATSHLAYWGAATCSFHILHLSITLHASFKVECNLHPSTSTFLRILRNFEQGRKSNSKNLLDFFMNMLLEEGVFLSCPWFSLRQ